MIQMLQNIKRTKRKPWRSKVNPIHVYIQEAYFRGWAVGTCVGIKALKGDVSTANMIASYKKDKPRILASVREMLKRNK